MTCSKIADSLRVLVSNYPSAFSTVEIWWSHCNLYADKILEEEKKISEVIKLYTHSPVFDTLCDYSSSPFNLN